MKSDIYCIYFINIVKSAKSFTTFNQVIIIMGMYFDGNKLIIIIEPKTFCLTKRVDKNLKGEVNSIRKQ